MRDENERLGFLQGLFEDQLVIRSTEVREQMSEVIIGQTPFTAPVILRTDDIAYESEYESWLYEEWIPDQEVRLEDTLDLLGNRERYSDLKEAAGKEQLVPLVGSGMSVPSGLSTWSAFLRSLVEYATLSYDELEALLAKGEFEEAAEKLKNGMPDRLFDERIDHDLRIPHGKEVEGAVRFLPALNPHVVVTTNLDNVLERAFKDQGAGFAQVLHGTSLSDYRSLNNPQETFLLKIHGDCRKPGTRVLTVTEYASAYAKGSDTRRELTLISQNHSLLCLGCSLGSDRTIGLLHDVAVDDPHIPKHFAMLRRPEKDKERIQREHFLTERGVFPIWYDGDHDESLQSLLVGLLMHRGAF